MIKYALKYIERHRERKRESGDVLTSILRKINFVSKFRPLPIFIHFFIHLWRNQKVSFLGGRRVFSHLECISNNNLIFDFLDTKLVEGTQA